MMSDSISTEKLEQILIVSFLTTACAKISCRTPISVQKILSVLDSLPFQIEIKSMYSLTIHLVVRTYILC